MYSRTTMINNTCASDSVLSVNSGALLTVGQDGLIANNTVPVDVRLTDARSICDNGLKSGFQICASNCYARYIQPSGVFTCTPAQVRTTKGWALVLLFT